MDREELFASIVAACPDRNDIVYLQRQGEQYQWCLVPPGDVMVDLARTDEPDVWMSFSAAASADRCRWPIDEPWPHFH